MEGTQSYRFLPSDVHVALPRRTVTVAFGLLNHVAKSVCDLSNWLLWLRINGETRRKVSKVVAEVMHERTGHPLA